MKFNRGIYSKKNPIFLNDNVWEEICKIEYNIGLIVDPNSCDNTHFCFVDGCTAFRIFPFNKKDGRWNYGSIDIWDIKTGITTSDERKYLNELIKILNETNLMDGLRRNGSMITEIKILKAISETMQCDKCPYPCKAKGKSSQANCVMHWSEILSNIEPHCDWGEVRYRIVGEVTS